MERLEMLLEQQNAKLDVLISLISKLVYEPNAETNITPPEEYFLQSVAEVRVMLFYNTNKVARHQVLFQVKDTTAHKTRKNKLGQLVNNGFGLKTTRSLIGDLVDDIEVHADWIKLAVEKIKLGKSSQFIELHDENQYVVDDCYIIADYDSELISVIANDGNKILVMSGELVADKHKSNKRWRQFRSKDFHWINIL